MQTCHLDAKFVKMEVSAGTEDVNHAVVDPLKLKESFGQVNHDSNHSNEDGKHMVSPTALTVQTEKNCGGKELEPSSCVQKCEDGDHDTTHVKNIVKDSEDVPKDVETTGENVPLIVNGCDNEPSTNCQVQQENNVVALEGGDHIEADELSASMETSSEVLECNEAKEPLAHASVNSSDVAHVTDGVHEVSIKESNEGTNEKEVMEDTSVNHVNNMIDNDDEKFTSSSQEPSQSHVKKKPRKLESILSNLKSKTLSSPSLTSEDTEDLPQVVEPIPDLPPGTVVVTPSDVGIAEKVRRKKHRKIKKHDLPLDKHKLEGMINAATDIKDLCGVTEGIIDPSVVEGAGRSSNITSVGGVNSVSLVASDSLVSTSIPVSSPAAVAIQQGSPMESNQLGHPVAVTQNVSTLPSQSHALPGFNGITTTMPVSQPLMLGITQNGNNFANQGQLSKVAVVNSASSQLQLLQRQQALQQADQYQNTIPSHPGGQQLIIQNQMQPPGAQIIVQGHPQQVMYNQHQGIGHPTYQVATNNPPQTSNQLQAPILTSHLQQPKLNNQFQNTPVQQYHSPGMSGAPPVLSSSPQLVTPPRLVVPPQQIGQLTVQPIQQQQQGASPVFQVAPQSTTQSKSQPVFVLQRGDTLKLDASGNLVVVARESAASDSQPPNSLPVSQQQSVVQSTPPPLSRPPPLQQLPQLLVRAPATTISSSLPGHNTVKSSESIFPNSVSTPVSVSMPPLQPISQLSSRLNAPVIPSVSVTATTTASTVSQSPAAVPLTQPQGILAQALQAPQSAYVDSASGLHLAASGLVQQKNLSTNQGQALIAKLQQPHVMQAISNAAMGVPSQVHVPSGSSGKQTSKQIKIVYRSTLPSTNQAKSSNQANQPKKVTLFSCSVCTKIFLHQETYEQHMLTHYGNQTCPNCKKVFTDLPKHRREGCYRRTPDAIRYGSYSFTCNYCNLRFRETPQLEAHIKKDHPEKVGKKLVAPVTLSNDSVKVKDTKVNNPKTNDTNVTAIQTPEVAPNKVEEKVSTPAVNVMTVVSEKTTGQYRKEVKVETIVKDKHVTSPRKADKDGLWVPTSRSHKKSKRQKKRNHPKSLLKDTPEPGYPKKAKESACDEWYGSVLITKDPECTTSKLVSKYGERKKSGKRPFHCKLCPKDFFSEHCLFEHIKIHTKPFTCGACGLRNARKDNIMKHIQLVHQGPKYRARDKRKREHHRERKGRKKMKTSEEGDNISDSDDESDGERNGEDEMLKNGNTEHDSDTELPTMVQQNSRLARLRRRSQGTDRQEEAQVEQEKVQIEQVKEEEQEEDAIEQITDFSPQRDGLGDGKVAVEKNDNDGVSEVTDIKDVCEESDAKIKANAGSEIVDGNNASKGTQDLSEISEHAMSSSQESTAANESVPVDDGEIANCKGDEKNEGSAESVVDAVDAMEVDSIEEVTPVPEGNANLCSLSDGLEVTEAVAGEVSDQEKQELKVADQSINQRTIEPQGSPSARLMTQSPECTHKTDENTDETVSTVSNKGDDDNDAIEAIDSCVLEAKVEENQQSEKDENNKDSLISDLQAGKSKEDVQGDGADVQILGSTAITVSTLFCSDESISANMSSEGIVEGNSDVPQDTFLADSPESVHSQSHISKKNQQLKQSLAADDEEPVVPHIVSVRSLKETEHQDIVNSFQETAEQRSECEGIRESQTTEKECEVLPPVLESKNGEQSLGKDFAEDEVAKGNINANNQKTSVAGNRGNGSLVPVFSPSGSTVLGYKEGLSGKRLGSPRMESMPHEPMVRFPSFPGSKGPYPPSQARQPMIHTWPQSPRQQGNQMLFYDGYSRPPGMFPPCSAPFMSNPYLHPPPPYGSNRFMPQQFHPRASSTGVFGPSNLPSTFTPFPGMRPGSDGLQKQPGSQIRGNFPFMPGRMPYPMRPEVNNFSPREGVAMAHRPGNHWLTPHNGFHQRIPPPGWFPVQPPFSSPATGNSALDLSNPMHPPQGASQPAACSPDTSEKLKDTPKKADGRKDAEEVPSSSADSSDSSSVITTESSNLPPMPKLIRGEELGKFRSGGRFLPSPTQRSLNTKSGDSTNGNGNSVQQSSPAEQVLHQQLSPKFPSPCISTIPVSERNLPQRNAQSIGNSGVLFSQQVPPQHVPMYSAPPQSFHTRPPPLNQLNTEGVQVQGPPPRIPFSHHLPPPPRPPLRMFQQAPYGEGFQNRHSMPASMTPPRRRRKRRKSLASPQSDSSKSDKISSPSSTDGDDRQSSGSSTSKKSPRRSSLDSLMYTDKNFPCPISPCRKSFKRPFYLKEHIAGHARAGDINPSDPSAPVSRKIVTTVTTSQGDMEIEVDLDRPYICHICGKGFKRKNNLADHVRTHSRPYKCGECKFDTIRWQYLAEHMRKAHNFDGDDKELEALFKQSGKKLKPTDIIPLSALTPITERIKNGRIEDLPNSLPRLSVSRRSSISSRKRRRRRHRQRRTSDLVDFFGKGDRLGALVSGGANEAPSITSPSEEPASSEELANPNIQGGGSFSSSSTQADNCREEGISDGVVHESVDRACDGDDAEKSEEDIFDSAECPDKENTTVTETRPSDSDIADSKAGDFEEAGEPVGNYPADVVNDCGKLSNCDAEEFTVGDTIANLNETSDGVKESPESGVPDNESDRENSVADISGSVSPVQEQQTMGSVQDVCDIRGRNEDQVPEGLSTQDTLDTGESEQPVSAAIQGTSSHPEHLLVDSETEKSRVEPPVEEVGTPSIFTEETNQSPPLLTVPASEPSHCENNAPVCNDSYSTQPESQDLGPNDSSEALVPSSVYSSSLEVPESTASPKTVRKVKKLMGRRRHKGRRGRKRSQGRSRAASSSCLQKPSCSSPPKTPQINSPSPGGIQLEQYFKVDYDIADRPFICNIDDCRKRFKSKQHMREHIFTHIKPYKCDYCGLGFPRTDYLAMHMKDEHKVTPSKDALFQKRKLANARAAAGRQRATKSERRRALYEQML